MNDTVLPRAPETNPESAPFWEAASRGELLIGQCGDCCRPHYFPRRHCPHCGSGSVEWRPAGGEGEIYSFVNVARGPAGPFIMAYVTLDEGVSLITRISAENPADLAIGRRVTLSFAPSDGGAPYPVFTPL